MTSSLDSSTTEGAQAIRAWLPAGVELVLEEGLFRRLDSGAIEIRLRTADGREAATTTHHGDDVEALGWRVRVLADELLRPSPVPEAS